MLVIPLETDSARAGRLMAAAADPALHLTASDLMEIVMQEPAETPSEGHADVRIVAASPEAARRVAEVLPPLLRSHRASSCPAGAGGGTRLELVVDTTRAAEPARSWLETRCSPGEDRRRE
ncbi:hypothetical protein [Streptomyces sp. UG1]|uniref:hypothetical protein n=1 Tax=Streptomyces sp. UG1 TaxID=3417652 RepID=UPI003CF43AA8